LRTHLSIQLFIGGLAALVMVSTATAYAAGITVASSNAGEQSVRVTAEDLRPSACAGLTLTQTVSGAGTLTGTPGNDLIIGSAGADTIDGQGGNDCILGGGGDDMLAGGDGNDVCLGGPGNDGFMDCEAEAQ
jgi:Ca2+-binding RTX toxin-like protein